MYSAIATTTTAEEREQLILDHIWLVQVIAARIHERLPVHVSFEDLVSAGTVGLISAIDNYDPERNVQLKTYSEYKIRGAILDSLRDLDWVPRSARKTAKEIAAAISAARQRYGREPEAEEIATEMKIPLDEYHELLTQARSIEPVSLEAATSEDGGMDMLRVLPDSEENQPSTLFERAELEGLLAEAIQRMPRIESTVLSMYYQDELSLKEIAQVLNVHFSRVSQLKAQAVLRLRAYIEKRTTPPLARAAVGGAHGAAYQRA